MFLLDGVSINIRYDDQAKKWVATVIAGSTSDTATAERPEYAIGRAVMAACNMTEEKLKAAGGK